jgi:spectinomycin phosphotransferase
VRTEPRDLDRETLRHILGARFGLRDPRLEYAPLGGGSHHWRTVDAGGRTWFVTVDDLEAGFLPGPGPDAAFAALERAFRTAAALRDEAALEFVVAPLADAEGRVLHRLGGRYAVRVAPFVRGEPGVFGVYSRDDRRRMGALLARLHSASGSVPAGLPRTDDLDIPSRAALAAAIGDLDRPWGTGPLADPARGLLRGRARAIERRLAEHDALAARVRRGERTWVVTHGEPHGGNVIREPGGSLRVVDWDTALLAPRERDLHMVLDDEDTGWDEYRAAAGPVELDRAALRLYRDLWDLADIATFTVALRRRHEQTADSEHALDSLRLLL